MRQTTITVHTFVDEEHPPLLDSPYILYTIQNTPNGRERALNFTCLSMETMEEYGMHRLEVSVTYDEEYFYDDILVYQLVDNAIWETFSKIERVGTLNGRLNAMSLAVFDYNSGLTTLVMKSSTNILNVDMLTISGVGWSFDVAVLGVEEGRVDIKRVRMALLVTNRCAGRAIYAMLRHLAAPRRNQVPILLRVPEGNPFHRARKLLMEHLSADQLREFRHTRTFFVTGSLGTLYRLVPRHSFAAFVYTAKGLHVANRCAYLPDVPVWDSMLAQKLLIETDEGAFEQNSNISCYASTELEDGTYHRRFLPHYCADRVHDSDIKVRRELDVFPKKTREDMMGNVTLVGGAFIAEIGDEQIPAVVGAEQGADPGAHRRLAPHNRREWWRGAARHGAY